MIGRAALLVCVLAACSKKPPPTAYDQLVAQFEPIVPALTALGAELQQSGSDCSRAARALDGFAAKHKAKLDGLMPLAAKLSPADQERFVEQMAKQFAETDRIFRSVSLVCPGHPEVLAALQNAGFAPKRPATPR